MKEKITHIPQMECMNTFQCMNKNFAKESFEIRKTLWRYISFFEFNISILLVTILSSVDSKYSPHEMRALIQGLFYLRRMLRIT